MKTIIGLIAVVALTSCQPKQKYEMIGANPGFIFRLDTETGQSWRFDSSENAWKPISEPH